MYKLLFLIFVFLPFVLKSQDVLSKKNHRELVKIIKKKGISVEYDSMINRSFTENRQQLQTAKQLKSIEKFIVGNWTQYKTIRITGEVLDIPNKPDILFTRDGRFQTQKQGKTVEGGYVINKEENSNLKLTYDEPQLPPFPEEMLKKMTQEEIQQNSFYVELWNIFEIGKNQFITYQVLPLFNPSNPVIRTHSRLRLNHYLKK